jgi:hypothetical protein
LREDCSRSREEGFQERGERRQKEDQRWSELLLFNFIQKTGKREVSSRFTKQKHRRRQDDSRAVAM